MDDAIRPDEIAAIAEEAYIYTFPMLMGYRFAYATHLQPASPGYRGPANSGPYGKAVPLDHTYKDVVTANSDTPYSFALLDLRAGPVVLSVPAITDRYYVMQFLNFYGCNDLFVGSRATGSDAQSWFLMGPSYQGDVPEGFTGSHRFETELAILAGRTQLLSAADQAACNEAMGQYRLMSYAEFQGGEAPTPPPFAWPLWQDEAAHDERFIGYLNALLPLCQPLHPEEDELFERFARIGIGPGVPFDADALGPEQQAAIARGVSSGHDKMAANTDTYGRLADGWVIQTEGVFGNRQFYAGDHLRRAVGAMVGYGGNDIIEAYYPQSRLDADGAPYDGNAKYQLRMAVEPPVRAFWSLTMYDTSYDGVAGYMVENPIDRFLINSTTEDLVRDEDGGLTITMQREKPTDQTERANWLPTPDGPFYLTFRLYWPEPAALDGSWPIPGVRRVG